MLNYTAAHMRVLIIEDEPAIVRMLERGLSAHGHRCISADNGEDGARLAVQEDVDLVLLDIMLPGLSGRRSSRGYGSGAPGCRS